MCFSLLNWHEVGHLGCLELAVEHLSMIRPPWSIGHHAYNQSEQDSDCRRKRSLPKDQSQPILGKN